jgi:hypothetical protein
MIGDFAAIYHNGRFERRKRKRRSSGAAVVSGSVCSSLDALHTTFQNNNCRSPCRDIVYDPSKLATILQKQIKGYTNRDPSVKPQKALPISVFHEMLKIQSTEADITCGHLSAGALFYAMLSCEYVKVSGLERRTKKIRLQDIRFFHGTQELSHEDPDLRFLAATVSITFRFQKTDE